MAPGEIERQPQEPPFWTMRAFRIGMEFVGAEIEPPLNELETAAIVGILNGTKPCPRNNPEEDIRYGMLFSTEDRFVCLNGLKRSLKEVRPLVAKELDRINGLVSSTVEA